MATMNIPKPFDGTVEQAKANFATHLWMLDLDQEVRCADCSSKQWHAAAKYPCGTEPERIDVEV